MLEQVMECCIAPLNGKCRCYERLGEAFWNMPSQTCTNLPAPQPGKNEFQGFHQFVDNDGDMERLYGSFEVFYHDGHQPDLTYLGLGGKGWYWWACFPNCLPDSEPSGPFPTSEGAYLDAIGD